MNFKEATDELLDRISHEELAEALGVSVASVRQARLDPQAKAHRSAPPDWETAVLVLTTKRIGELSKLAKLLKTQRVTNPAGKSKKIQ